MARDDFRLTPPPFKLSENDVERACVDLLRYRHFYPLRQQSGRFLMPDERVLRVLAEAGVPVRWGTVGEPGIPDYAIPRGFVEVKRPGGTLSQVQKEKIWMLKEHWDLETAVVESVEELVRWLEEHWPPAL